MTWLPMTAKYASKCAFCDEKISKGDIIRWDKSKVKAIHNKCFKKRYNIK